MAWNPKFQAFQASSHVISSLSFAGIASSQGCWSTKMPSINGPSQPWTGLPWGNITFRSQPMRPSGGVHFFILGYDSIYDSILIGPEKKDMTWNEPWAESTRWASVFDIFAFFWWPGHQKWRKMRGQWVSGRCGGQKGQPHGWDVRSWVLSWVRWCSSWNMAIGICPTVNVAICRWRTWFSVGESWGLRDGNSSHVGVHSWGIAFIEYLWRKCDPLLTYWKTTPNSVISVT